MWPAAYSVARAAPITIPPRDHQVRIAGVTTLWFAQFAVLLLPVPLVIAGRRVARALRAGARARRR